MINQELLEKSYNYFKAKKTHFDEMYLYYKGESRTLRDYFTFADGERKSNNKISVNFVKKFIKEEVSYSIGNDINYISKSDNTKVIEDITLNISHWSEQHDSRLMNKMLTYGFAFELYYIDSEARFCSKIITPREGFAFTDDYGNVIFFMHVYEKKFDSNVYIDVYDNTTIYHYVNNVQPQELQGVDKHIFRQVPVSIAQISEEKEHDTIFNDIKTLQDAYETNLSDISNEISDFRNAYLSIFGFQIQEQDVDKLKKLGIIQVNSDKGRAEWLIKNINDSFIQNTLSTQEDKIYQISSHINHNEKMQSNLSGVALRSRLISLEEKCKLNNRAFADAIKSRVKFLFIYLNLKEKKSYDYRDIKVKFTPNIPQDDASAAQIIQQLGDKLPLDVGLSLLSFIDNPTATAAKAKKEQQEMMDEDLKHNDDSNMMNDKNKKNNSGGKNE